MTALSFLDGLSGWWWLALALGLIVLEMMSFTYFLIWIGAAAAVTGVALLLVPTMGGAAQLTIFALLGLIFTVAGRAATRRWRTEQGGDAPAMNRRAEQMVGREGVVIEDFTGAVGAVTIDDVRWRARLDPAPPASPEPRAGARLRVTGVEGATLVCASVV